MRNLLQIRIAQFKSMLRYRDLLLLAPESRGAMNSLRKWLYRPRRDDKSLLAKFW